MQSHEFVPIAFETLGPVNALGLCFLNTLGRRMTHASGDPRESSFLFQRLSVTLQRYNSVAFRATFNDYVADDP